MSFEVAEKLLLEQESDCEEQLAYEEELHAREVQCTSEKKNDPALTVRAFKHMRFNFGAKSTH